jgi:predicted S18 family serine protease
VSNELRQTLLRQIEQLRTDLRYYEGAVTRTQARIRALEAELEQQAPEVAAP